VPGEPVDHAAKALPAATSKRNGRRRGSHAAVISAGLSYRRCRKAWSRLRWLNTGPAASVDARNEQVLRCSVWPTAWRLRLVGRVQEAGSPPTACECEATLRTLLLGIVIFRVILPLCMCRSMRVRIRSMSSRVPCSGRSKRRKTRSLSCSHGELVVRRQHPPRH
jgi:hypothetical protein